MVVVVITAAKEEVEQRVTTLSRKGGMVDGLNKDRRSLSAESSTQFHDIHKVTCIT